MKLNARKLVAPLSILMIVLFMTGCYEQHYYTRNHHHSTRYYHRHHETPPPGIDIDIHN